MRQHVDALAGKIADYARGSVVAPRHCSVPQQRSCRQARCGAARTNVPRRPPQAPFPTPFSPSALRVASSEVHSMLPIPRRPPRRETSSATAYAPQVDALPARPPQRQRAPPPAHTSHDAVSPVIVLFAMREALHGRRVKSSRISAGGRAAQPAPPPFRPSCRPRRPAMPSAVRLSAPLFAACRRPSSSTFSVDRGRACRCRAPCHSPATLCAFSSRSYRSRI